jgi:hypothetical protein
MPSFEMLQRVALPSTDVSEERPFSTRLKIPEDGILHSRRRRNLKSDIAFYSHFEILDD